MIDIKEKAAELAGKIQSDPQLLEKFKTDPVSVVESLLGVDLPDDQVKAVAEGIKARIKLDGVGGMLGGLFGKK